MGGFYLQKEHSYESVATVLDTRPDDAKWYLTDIIQEFSFVGDYDNVVYKNLILVRADSPEEAYEKAMLLGKDYNFSYDNTDGEKVTSTFRGLRDLYVIYEDFEHGAEILYGESEGLSEDEILNMITPKAELAVFAPREVDEDD